MEVMTVRLPFSLVCCATLLAAGAAGCRTEPQYGLIDPAELPEDREEPKKGAVFGQEEGTRWWNVAEETPLLPEEASVALVPASKAESAPKLTVSYIDGSRVRITPGAKGRVTIVLFWSMDVPVPAGAVQDPESYIREEPVNVASTAAAKHVRDLVNKYGRMGVRGLGIVERTFVPAGKDRKLVPTGTYKLAPAFLQAKEVQYPNYYDDFSALKRMCKAAGLEYKRAELPFIFIVDGRQTVRFGQWGFGYIAGRLSQHDVTDEHIVDNAPGGRRIEDYLVRILKEDR
jgi:hypothetical protein